MVEKVSSNAFSSTRISALESRSDSDDLAVQNAVLFNGMDHGPGQRKKNDRIPLQLQRIIAPGVHAIHFLKAADDHLRRDLDQFVRAGIGHSKFQRGDVLIGRDDRVAAEQHVRRWPRDTGEQQAGNDGETRQPDQCLQPRPARWRPG